MKSLILGIMLLSTPVIAQPKYVPKIIPKCIVVELKAGGKGCVYTLPQVKKLYDLDSELNALRVTDKLSQQKLKLQGSIITKMTKQLELSHKSLQTVQDRLKEMTRQLIETDRKYQLERVKPRWGSYLSWGIVVAVTAAFTSYVVADQVSK